MRIGKFGVGDLVRENIEHEGERERWNPPDIGLIVKWSQDGWLVVFPSGSTGDLWWMNPDNLELVSETR